MSLLGDPKGRSSDLLQVGVIVFFLSQQAEQSFSLNPADRGARKPTISLYGPIASKFVLAHDAPLSWLSSNGGKATILGAKNGRSELQPSCDCPLAARNWAKAWSLVSQPGATLSFPASARFSS
jgi:hypothetical protein